jgi:hypothetical protein
MSLRTELRINVRLSAGTYLLFRALSVQKQLPVAHLVKRAMHEHWQQALHEDNVEYRSKIHGELISLRLRPSLAERVRLAVNRNRSAMVERCCLLYVDTYSVKSSPRKSDDSCQQQTDSNPDGLAASTES